MCGHCRKFGKYKIKGRKQTPSQSHDHFTVPSTKSALTVSHLDYCWSRPDLHPCLSQFYPHLTTDHPHSFQDDFMWHSTYAIRSPSWMAIPLPSDFTIPYALLQWTMLSQRYFPHITKVASCLSPAEVGGSCVSGKVNPHRTETESGCNEAESPPHSRVVLPGHFLVRVRMEKVTSAKPSQNGCNLGTSSRN